MARKLFGEDRFQEIMGELWIQERRILERAGPEPAELARVLLEWEDRFHRDVEEGRYQHPRGRRNRVMRVSEVEKFDDEPAADPWSYLIPHIREKF